MLPLCRLKAEFAASPVVGLSPGPRLRARLASAYAAYHERLNLIFRAECDAGWPPPRGFCTLAELWLWLPHGRREKTRASKHHAKASSKQGVMLTGSKQQRGASARHIVLSPRRGQGTVRSTAPARPPAQPDRGVDAAKTAVAAVSLPVVVVVVVVVASACVERLPESRAQHTSQTAAHTRDATTP